jgi:phosphatidylglycerol:prolipoprotein diacylglycerol transferase
MTFPNIDPVAVQLGPVAIHWYALAYVVGIILGYYYISWLDRKQPKPFFTEKAKDDLMFYAVLGVLLGGRIGYILFYNLPHYLDNPADALKIWHGGMSFHGGLLGIFIAFWMYARKYKLPWLRIMDYLATATPIGLFFGRIANFVNGELYGRVTDSKWGMVFPNGGPEPRYPSQLFEAGLEGLLLFIILYIAARHTSAFQYRGRVGGIFVMGYGLARFTIEFFRQPDEQLGYLALGATMGQLLCVPMILFGAWLIVSAKKHV